MAARRRLVRADPRDEEACPPTMKAADGVTRLNRYRVDAVVYAPTIREARARIEHDIYIDAARVERG